MTRAEIERRDALACRRLHGEVLTPAEEDELATLNRLVAELISRSEPLPEDVRAAMEEVRLRSKK
jgi:hypothetical protein